MEILDKPQQRSRQEIIQCWEEKRWTYNLIMILVIALAFALESIVLDYHFKAAIYRILPSILIGIFVANIAYCMG